MSYASLEFYILLLAVLCLYYLAPKRLRWIALLTGSCAFYYFACPSKKLICVFLGTTAVTYACSRLIETQRLSGASARLRKITFGLSIAFVASILLLSKTLENIPSLSAFRSSFLLPLGLAFYSLMLIAYLTDVYRGTINAQKNFLKYLLFVSFFPHIIQGPIHRYDDLSKGLFDGNDFDEKNVMKGINLILWGFFLKLMIADKAGVVVHTIDASPEAYKGFYHAISGILYLFHLYADFLSCVTLSRGIAQLFGISLQNNFRQPFFSLSIKEMWVRWHMTLGTWLRDYIYFPLGGGRKGKFRKYFNLAVTFFVSGIWHGMSLKFICWGLMQVPLQWAEDVSGLFKKKPDRMSLPERLGHRIYAFLAMDLGVFIFKAPSLKVALSNAVSVFKDANPEILFDGSLLRLGLNEKEWFVLFLSLLALLVVGMIRERGISIQEWFLSRKLPTRWCMYFLMIWTMWIFGTYGYGFDSSAFIYGGF